MRIQPLASGSAGNATLVESARTRVLVDAGYRLDELEERLAQADIRSSSIDAILLTHRHKDHARGATDFALRHRCKVIGTHRTLRSVGSQVNRRKHTIRVGNEFTIGALRGRAFEVAHDAPETVGFRLRDEQHLYGHVTDLGHWTDENVDELSHCHALLIEFNHDPELLRNQPEYARALKERIGGDRGHLSNGDAAELLARVRWPGLSTVFLAHISSRTNTPELALEAARTACPRDVDLQVALQDAPTPAVVLDTPTGDPSGATVGS